MIAVVLPALEQHGRVTLDEATRAKLLEVSAATIDRLLAEVRVVAGNGRRRPAGFGSAVRRGADLLLQVRCAVYNGMPSPPGQALT